MLPLCSILQLDIHTCRVAPQEVIKRLRFGIPDGLENIPADWGKVVSFTEYSLTQRRSKMKKVVSLHSILTVLLSEIDRTQICASLKPQEDKITKTITFAEDSEHHNIFELATAMVKGTKCTVNIILCSRIALMVCTHSI
jgi:hypothetical protein